MNKSLLVLAAVLAVLGVGAYWFMSDSRERDSSSMMGDTGTYAYACDNGSQFSMTPSNDVSFLTLSAGSQGMFTGTVTLHKMGDGVHYETTEGQLIVLSGAGEEVQLTVGSESTTCNPVPNSEMAPWNWGDRGEGAGSMQPPTSLVVTESIQGKWQSVDDAKFVREFRSGDRVIDFYDGAEVSSGMWVAFVKGVDAPEVSFPLVENTAYIQMTVTGTQADTLNFKVHKLTPEELELTNMDRGGVLRFRSIQ